jgi:predicted polyphosphate/ATP-dependent NAD kinase
MLDSGVEMVIAFAGGKGTADMVNRAREAGVEVCEVSA